MEKPFTQSFKQAEPFQNFKYEIDNSGEYRQQWFDFKQERGGLCQRFDGYSDKSFKIVS